MNYDASLCLVVLLALHSEWRVLRFELVLLSLVDWKLLPPIRYPYCLHRWCSYQSARSCRVAKRLGLLLWWAIVSELCHIGLSKEFAFLFYIPSPSDVGIVFLLRLTTIIALRLKNYCVVEEHSAPEIV